MLRRFVFLCFQGFGYPMMISLLSGMIMMYISIMFAGKQYRGQKEEGSNKPQVSMTAKSVSYCAGRTEQSSAC